LSYAGTSLVLASRRRTFRCHTLRYFTPGQLFHPWAVVRRCFGFQRIADLERSKSAAAQSQSY